MLSRCSASFAVQPSALSGGRRPGSAAAARARTPPTATSQAIASACKTTFLHGSASTFQTSPSTKRKAGLRRWRRNGAPSPPHRHRRDGNSCRSDGHPRATLRRLSGRICRPRFRSGRQSLRSSQNWRFLNARAPGRRNPGRSRSRSPSAAERALWTRCRKVNLLQRTQPPPLALARHCVGPRWLDIGGQ